MTAKTEAQNYKTDDVFWALLRKSAIYDDLSRGALENKAHDDTHSLERAYKLMEESHALQAQAWDHFFSKLNPELDYATDRFSACHWVKKIHRLPS
jgi:hypothetical protein